MRNNNQPFFGSRFLSCADLVGGYLLWTFEGCSKLFVAAYAFLEMKFIPLHFFFFFLCVCVCGGGGEETKHKFIVCPFTAVPAGIFPAL